MTLLRAIMAEGAQTAFDPLAAIPWAHAGWADDPDWLVGIGDDGLNLYGVANSYAYSLDASPLDITGDITLVAKITPLDWTPTANSVICGKWTGMGSWSYLFVLETGGILRFNWTTDGNTINAAASTAATGFTDATTHWVAVTFDVDNGAAGRTARFWTSSDGVSWSQLGSAVTSATATSIFNSTARFEIGSNSSGAAAFLAGMVHRTQIYSGIRDLNAGTGGALAFDADFTGKPGQTSFSESSSNAATVTVGSAARLGPHVSSWRNISGDDIIQSTPGYQPVIDYNGLGGKRAVVFDGTDDRLLNNIVDIAQPISLVVIAQSDTGTGTQTLLAGGCTIYISSSFFATFAGSPAPSAVAGDTAAHLHHAYFSGASSVQYLDGASISTANPGSNAYNQITLGSANAGTSNFLDGSVAFWGVYAGNIHTDPGWATFKAWVQSYYGITVS